MLVDTLDKLHEVIPDLLACMGSCVDTEYNGNNRSQISKVVSLEELAILKEQV